jgi:hypothetical protein
MYTEILFMGTILMELRLVRMGRSMSFIRFIIT